MIDDRIIARVAELYYLHGISQYEIADKFNFSKAKVCRLIKEAKKRKVIEFRIKNIDKRALDLEQEIEKAFKLKEAIIFYNSDIKGYDENLIFQEVGKIGADYLKRVLDNNLNFAVTWGKTLYYTIKNLSVEKKYNGINVFSTIGSVNLAKIEYQAVNISQMFSERIGGTCYPIYLPLLLKISESKGSLARVETMINKIMGDTSKIDYYITGVGVISKNSRTYTLGGFDLDFFRTLTSKKIVGDVGLNFYDINGNFIESDFEDRIVKLGIDKIKKIRNKIAIAFGPEKIEALKGFLKTEIADVFITDSKTAEKLLA